MTTAEFLRTNSRWLGAGALLTFLSSFGQTFFISLFSGEIRAEFGLTDGQWSLLYSVGTMASAGVMVWAGALTDRFRTRQLGRVVLLGLALACAAMALNQNAVLLIGVIFALRLFGQGMASHLAIVAMSRWFVATRGRALAVCTLGFTFGEAVFPILFVGLLTILDWRILWLVSVGLVLLGIPLLSRLLAKERHPQQIAKETQSTGMGDAHWSRPQVLRHPLFWLMVPALLGPSAFNTAFFFHHVHYAETIGWSHLAFVSYFPIYTVIAVLAMLVSGRALDKFGSARLLPFYQLPMVAAFLLFGLGQSTLTLVLALSCLAFTSGANSTLPNAFWAEFYGTRHLGAIKSFATAVMVLGSAIGPGVTGVLLDLDVGLASQYVGVAVFFLLTTVCMWYGVASYQNMVPRYRDLRK